MINCFAKCVANKIALFELDGDNSPATLYKNEIVFAIGQSKSTNPRYREKYVIALTAYGILEVTKHCLEEIK